MIREIICHCSGSIRNAEAWKLGRYDWRWLYWCFGRHVRLSDFDYFVECNGHFLVIETKALNAPESRGQYLALERMAALPEFTVVMLWGREPDCPEFMAELPRPRQRCDREDVMVFVQNWWRTSNTIRAGNSKR